MMKATTETSLSTKILSWFITLIICGGIVLFFIFYPVSDQSQTPQKEKGKQPRVKEAKKQNKHEQSQRPLPPDYARQLVTQSEVLAKKDLFNRLKKFEEMSNKMRQQKDELLLKVENRKLPSSAPRDANDTSMAKNIPRPDKNALGVNPSIDELYELLREYELDIQQNHIAVNAAKQTLTRGLSFPEVYNSLKTGSTRMLKFEELVRNQKNGEEWSRSSSSNASGGLDIKNTADLNNYRGLLGEASRQAGLAGARLEGLFGIPSAGNRAGKPGGTDGSGKPDGYGDGSGNGDGGQGGVEAGTGGSRRLNHYQGAQLNQALVTAQALPGRRFSKNAERKGWLYINTWYMIGPWENFGRDDFAVVHSPEISVDFDAVYTDGQKGTGIAETDSHPLKVIGNQVYLNGTLRWQFKQSESMHNTVPVTTNHSTYYAYTELYFDEATAMLVAIGTDDSGRVWINGKDVWQDRGSSWYNIDEHITSFQFREGWNTVLIRLENGDGPTGFSFLIIPKK
ncbi:MAG: OmpH family outer membrane protein [Prevotella sp.]|jgi:hypothetical protein|nr:OmpH family outer membrane protein [Prevotella sp.]